MQQLKCMKPEILDLLATWGPEDWQTFFDERAGIGQFDHGQAKIARQFEENFHTPPLYYFQLLAFAQGLPYDRLGLERQRLKPDCLRRLEVESAAAQ